MGKVWVLDTETKGTGAEMVPLEKVLETRGPEAVPARTSRKRRAQRAVARPAEAPRKPTSRSKTSSGPLPPGHVRKKATGEIGRVQSVDAKAGTASVLWLRQGRSSTVPLATISRR
jgi:hypothetical protein